MNFTFGTESRPGYLHFAGVWAEDVFYITEYEMMSLTHEQMAELKLLMAELTRVPGLTVKYEPQNRRWCICYGIPSITIMDTHRVEYENDED